MVHGKFEATPLVGREVEIRKNVQNRKKLHSKPAGRVCFPPPARTPKDRS